MQVTHHVEHPNDLWSGIFACIECGNARCDLVFFGVPDCTQTIVGGGGAYVSQRVNCNIYLCADCLQKALASLTGGDAANESN